MTGQEALHLADSLSDADFEYFVKSSDKFQEMRHAAYGRDFGFIFLRRLEDYLLRHRNSVVYIYMVYL